VNFGTQPGEKGLWEGNAGATLATNPPGGLDNPSMYLPTNLKLDDVPWQPWARAVYDYRQAETTKDDPHVRCKASGGPRMFHTPYGFEFIDAQEEKKMYILGVGGPHSWRVIYMDGRAHPKDLDPSFSGHSVGHWEGETLVVETTHINPAAMYPGPQQGSVPIGRGARISERIRLKGPDTLVFEITTIAPEVLARPDKRSREYVRSSKPIANEITFCTDYDRSIEPGTGKQRFDLTPPADLPPPPPLK
jgi:hypothetical protein